MAATLASVQACSLTGEFSALTAEQVAPFIEEAALHYGSLVAARRASQLVVDRLTSLHAAHLLHLALKLEAGEGEIEGEGLPGDVKSASLDRIGSWTFGTPSLDAKQAKDYVPLADWTASPYGRRWRGLWGTVATGTASTRVVS